MSPFKPPVSHLRMLRHAVLIAAVVMIGAACTPAGPSRVSTVPSVDLSRYLGTWYEVASVKQFFSVGLVDTTADYSLLPNGFVRVENRGRYFAADGPAADIVGTAIPVDPSNARLNVSFTGDTNTNTPGNYWIVDLDADYQWAIVSDPTGESCFFLSRTRTITPAARADLETRAAARGVDLTNLTDTPQP